MGRIGGWEDRKEGVEEEIEGRKVCSEGGVMRNRGKDNRYRERTGGKKGREHRENERRRMNESGKQGRPKMR